MSKFVLFGKKFAKIIIVISVIQIIIFLLNPARWPEKVIRWTILRDIPIGTLLKDAQKIIDEKDDWEIDQIYNESEFDHSTEEPLDIVELEEQTMRVHFGDYKTFFFLFDCDVIVFFEFDKNEKLVDVIVDKQFDSL